MIVRRALPSEFDHIYMFGYDAWHQGLSSEEFIHKSNTYPPYAHGIWYVLERDSQPVCKLICYRDVLGLSDNNVGIGSVATAPALRGHGYASKLMMEVIDILKSENVPTVFLHSEIDIKFYERFGFRALPGHQQEHLPNSVCMRLDLNSPAAPSALVPAYF